ncbi:hypothetical protein B0H16DRAFT_1749448 [Mycena metata]|uniref:DUF6570 domain-containing protein n=1 Tax=Mycena metata TaxID=1033252 RepID=A0AAD7GNL4_9AGAR|nr:hypothetical protein B0H16DRAFT_1749448 [Mycena metata]
MKLLLMLEPNILICMSLLVTSALMGYAHSRYAGTFAVNGLRIAYFVALSATTRWIFLRMGHLIAIFTRKKIPKNALALHNWLGPVPPQLQNLKYAEKMMIARPVLKVYNKLPPSRDEMNEILAFIYTGSTPPTPEEFDRTPMLVRRSKVLAALEWLKLNHEGYQDLEISMDNLNTYSERDIPVAVDFRRSKQRPEDSHPLSARSVYDDGEEYGVESGECPFACTWFNR